MQRAFQDESRLQFPLEVEAGLVQGATRSFASEPVRHTLAFPRNQVRLLNSCSRTSPTEDRRRLP